MIIAIIETIIIITRTTKAIETIVPSTLTIIIVTIVITTIIAVIVIIVQETIITVTIKINLPTTILILIIAIITTAIILLEEMSMHIATTKHFSMATQMAMSLLFSNNRSSGLWTACLQSVRIPLSALLAPSSMTVVIVSVTQLTPKAPSPILYLRPLLMRQHRPLTVPHYLL